MEMAESALFYFQALDQYDEKGDKKFLKPGVLPHLQDIYDRLQEASDFSLQGLEDVFKIFLEEKQIKLGKVAQPIRVALTGRTASPGLFEVMEVLGKQEVLERIERAMNHIEEKAKKQNDGHH